MTNQEVIDYVLYTPNNINPAILKQKLEQQDFENRPDWNQNDPTAPDYVKNRPFYEKQELFLDLTKDDIKLVEIPDDGTYFRYTSSPRIDWITSIESIYWEMTITFGGESVTITSDDFYEKEVWTDSTENGNEIIVYLDDVIKIMSGLDDKNEYFINLYGYDYMEAEAFHLKIYRVNMKKIPGKLVDINVGGTAFTAAGEYFDEEVGEVVEGVIPYLWLETYPNGLSPETVFVDPYYKQLRVSGNIMPFNNFVNIKFNEQLTLSVGASKTFIITKDDEQWDILSHINSNSNFTAITFSFIGTGNNQRNLHFFVPADSKNFHAMTCDQDGNIYFVNMNFTNNHSNLEGVIKRIL